MVGIPWLDLSSGPERYIFTYMNDRLVFCGNVDRYTIHGSYGKIKTPTTETAGPIAYSIRHASIGASNNLYVSTNVANALYAWYIYLYAICNSMAYVFLFMKFHYNSTTHISLHPDPSLFTRGGMSPLSWSHNLNRVVFEHLGWWFRICFMFNPRKGVRFPISKGLFHHQLVTLGLFQWLEFFLCIPEDHWESGFCFWPNERRRKTPNFSI